MNKDLLTEIAIEALNDETTVNRWRWIVVLNLVNDETTLSPGAFAWAEGRIQELKMLHCLPISETSL